MSTPTNSFPTQTTIAASDTFLMNVSAASAKVSGTNVISNLGLPTLAAANTFTAANTFALGSIATSQPHVFSETWNAGGVTFNALNVNITNTASAIGSRIFASTVGGSDQFLLRSRTGPVWGLVANELFLAGPVYSFASFATASAVTFSSATWGIDGNLGGVYLANNYGVGWSANANLGSFDKDTGINRASAGVAEVNNGTAGTLRDISVRNVLVNGGSMVPVTFTKAAVDLKSVAVTDLFTVPAGKTFICQDCVVLITSANTATVGWAASVIESGASASMFTGATTAGTLNTNAAGLYYPHSRNPVATAITFTSCAAGNKVQYSVGTGATATTLTATIYITGLLV